MISNLLKKPFLIYLPILLSFILLALMTDKGIGFTPDSVAYLNTSDNLAAGKGFILSYGSPPDQWNSHYPPLYSALLAVPDWIGLPDLSFIRWLQLLFLILFLLTMQKIINGLNQSPFVSFFNLLIISVSIPVLVIYSNAWSEGLFLWIGFLSFYLLSRLDLSKVQNQSLLVLGFVFAFTNLTRYAGITFLGTAAVFILFQNQKTLLRGIIQNIFLGIPTLILYAAWFGISQVYGAHGANREFGINSLPLEKIQSAIGTVLEWFYIPASTPTGLKLVFLVAIFSLIIFIFVKKWSSWISPEEKNQPPALLKLIMLFFIIYPLFILGSVIFLDANIPLNTRILAPFFISLILILLSIIPQPMSKPLGLWIKLALAAFFVIQIGSLIPIIRTNYTTGIGFNHQFWREADVWDEISQGYHGETVVSNAPEPLYLFTRFNALSLPKKYLTTTQEMNTLYAQELNSLKTVTLEAGDLLVYFPRINSDTLPTEAELLENLPWTLLYSTEQANIYIYQPN